MKSITSEQMRRVSGGIEEGTVCGAFVAATIGATFLFSPLAGALVYMFTSAACALDYGSR